MQIYGDDFANSPSLLRMVRKRFRKDFGKSRSTMFDSSGFRITLIASIFALVSPSSSS